MKKAIKFEDGKMIECVSKNKRKTFTNGMELLIDQTLEDLKFVSEGSWWHIEPANTDCWGVHYEHGKSFAKDFVRYVRASGNDAAFLCVFQDMCKQMFSDWRIKAVAEGFMSELNTILINAKRIDIYQ